MRLLEIFKKEQEYVSCEWLENGIHMTISGLSCCDKYSHEGGNYLSKVPLNKDNMYDFKTFFGIRQKDRKKAKKGIIPDSCKGCKHLEIKKWDKSKKIKHMAISTNMSCNSRCIYCSSYYKKTKLNKLPEIPILDFLKKALLKGLISSDCEVQIGGGEPVLNKEFTGIISLLTQYNLSNIYIYSSGIQYSKDIEDCLKNNMIKELIISPDAGNREIYKQIKTVDKFDEVWTNISKYCSVQKDNVVVAKYIIIPNINSDASCIEEFFNKVVEANVKYVGIEVEREWYKYGKKKQEKIEQIIYLIKKMEKSCEELNIKYKYFPTAEYLIQDYKELYNNFE